MRKGLVDERYRAPAHLTLQGGPTAIPGAQATFYDLTVENRSGYDWDPNDKHPVRLSYHWVNDQGELIVADGVRTNLPHTVPGGDRCRVAARVHPPPAPGRYTLAIYVLREGVGWFDPPLKLEVDCLPVTQRRVLLVNNICLAHDAVGNNAVLKLRLLQKSGFAPLLLTGYIDERWPLDEQALMVEVDHAQILDPPPDLQWVADHFSQAS